MDSKIKFFKSSSHLSGSLTVKIEKSTDLFFTAGTGFVNFVSQNEHRAVGELLIRQKTLCA